MAKLRSLAAIGVLIGGTSVGLTWGAVQRSEPPAPLNQVPAEARPEELREKGTPTHAEEKPDVVPKIDESRLKKFKAGDYLKIEALQALPARPIRTLQRVRNDGTISLSYYGDLSVEGLNRNQIKVRLIKHLRRFLTDEALGLVAIEQDDAGGINKKVRINPLDSTSVYVEERMGPNELNPDEVAEFDEPRSGTASGGSQRTAAVRPLRSARSFEASVEQRLQRLEGMMEELLTEVKKLQSR